MQTYPQAYAVQDTGIVDRRIMDFINSDIRVHNAHPGFFQNQVQLMQTHLRNQDTRALYTSVAQDKLEVLYNQPLLVPEYVLMESTYDPTGNIYHSRRRMASEVFGQYGFSYEVVPTQQLSERITDTRVPFFYLSYLQVGKRSVISVVNALTGEIIYSEVDKIRTDARHLTTAHLDDLQKAIAKAANRPLPTPKEGLSEGN